MLCKFLLGLLLILVPIWANANTLQNLNHKLYTCEVEILFYYNLRHHTHFSPISVSYKELDSQTYAETLESSMFPWRIVINQAYLYATPDYVLSHVLPHEMAHYICDTLHGDCGHGVLWQQTAIELGVPLSSHYLTNYNGPATTPLNVPCLSNDISSEN